MSFGKTKAHVIVPDPQQRNKKQNNRWLRRAPRIEWISFSKSATPYNMLHSRGSRYAETPGGSYLRRSWRNMQEDAVCLSYAKRLRHQAREYTFLPVHPAAPAQNRLHPPVTVATPQAEVTTIASLAGSGDLHLYTPSSCRNLFLQAPSSSVLNSGDLHLHDPAPVGDPHPAQPDLSSPPMSPTYINLISPSPTLYASPPTADTNTVVTYCPVRPNAEQKMYNTDDTVSEDFNASPTAPKPLTAFDLVMNDMSFFDVDTIAFTNSSISRLQSTLSSRLRDHTSKPCGRTMAVMDG